jgi:hypothetical protein
MRAADERQRIVITINSTSACPPSPRGWHRRLHDENVGAADVLASI